MFNDKQLQKIVLISVKNNMMEDIVDEAQYFDDYFMLGNSTVFFSLDKMTLMSYIRLLRRKRQTKLYSASKSAKIL